MKKRLLILAISISISAIDILALGIDSIDQVVYLIGNTSSGGIKESHLVLLQKYLDAEENQYSVINLGDFRESSQSGKLEPDPGNILNSLKPTHNGRVFYIPGDEDWVNTEKTRNSLPRNGCPGPEIEDISPHLRIIAINTGWWLHFENISESPGADCRNITREEFIENLEEAIEDADGRNILIVGHNPVVSAGIYGGHMTVREHLFPFADQGKWIPLPVLGSFYAAYRQNVGTVRDMSSINYQAFISQMSGIMSKNPGLIYASAHDYNLQLLDFEQGYQVVSGSINDKRHVGKEQGALFSSADYGFAKITYYNSGKTEIGFYSFGTNEPIELYSRNIFRSACDEKADTTIPVNMHVIPCLEEEEVIEAPVPSSINDPGAKVPLTLTADSVTKRAGLYEVKGLKRMLGGSLYRSTWTTPVRVPYLDLDTMKAFALGGGRQTTTLKFLTDNGSEYAFRSVDKDLTKAVPNELRYTIVSKMVKQATATGHPYGALIVSSLLDETDILHARPELYVLPDHPALGTFRAPYAGLLGMLEERPKDPVGKTPGFMGADDITRSMGLFRKLYKDNDYYVNAEAFGEARVFDMLIGDWGRHEDNWKWAGYNSGNKRVYYPIPRDRDHAFSRWNGLFPYLADREWAMPMVENFDYDFHDIKSLTWPARHLDRLLLSELDRNDWNRISLKMQKTMNDDVIDSAISRLPSEVIDVSGREIGDKLKSRRAELPDAVDKYYMLLAKEVDVTGSNKHEYFEIYRMETGNVSVKMYKQNKEGKVHFDDLLFNREFVRKETREIAVYGLGGNDIFNVTGSAKKSIPVRIIGGPGQDEINDHSFVKGLRKQTIVYDTKSTVVNPGAETKNNLSDDPGINRYDPKSFKYNTYFPKPLIYYSSDNGLTASLGMNRTTYGFRKDDYKASYDIYFKTGTYRNEQFGVKAKFNDLIGKWDVGIGADYGVNYPHYNFFGLGNNTVKDAHLYNAGDYRINVRGLMSNLYVEKEIVRKAIFRFGMLYEDLNSNPASDTLLAWHGTTIPGSDAITLGGLQTSLSLDFRDRQVFATRGLQFKAENRAYYTISGASGNFGTASSFLKYYATMDWLFPVTIVGKAGGSKNYGNQIPFYKYASLGHHDNLRGYRRDRFMGDASLYLNSELRLHLGRVHNHSIPFEYGITGFYDLGKVWFEGNSEGGWHSAYGTGFYISPLTRDYLLNIQFESSTDESLLVRFGIGFYLDD